MLGRETRDGLDSFMRYTRAFIPTLKEAPSDATGASHALLLRAGYARRVGAGIYSYLPLGLRVLRRIERVVREELERTGALELLLPALLPAELLREVGRWDAEDEELLRVRDRKGTELYLASTHEEVIAELARRELRSYRELPARFYQVQTKHRDEPRPRGGLLRSREFVVADAYSLDADEEAARLSYATLRAVCERICARLGLQYRWVLAEGGERSEELQVLGSFGEDELAACLQCSYAANVDVATSPPYPRRGPSLTELAPRELVHTPGHGSVADVAGFLKLPLTSFLKSLVYVVGGETVLAVVRGDHEVNEAKLARALGGAKLRLASAQEVEQATGAAVGFAGPVGFRGRVLVDRDAASVADGCTGANCTDHHLLHVAYGRDFTGDVVDIRSVVDGDLCPECGASLSLYRGLEVGQLRLLGAMNATFSDAQGTPRPLVMGSYALGLSRLLAALVEQHHDQHGLRFPAVIAPFQAHLVQLGTESEVLTAVARLERELEAAGIELLIDDRDERPGVKLKDADLLGIPLRLTLGKKSLAAGGVELKLRSQPEQSKLVALERVTPEVSELVQQALHASAAGEAA